MTWRPDERGEGTRPPTRVDPTDKSARSAARKQAPPRRPSRRIDDRPEWNTGRGQGRLAGWDLGRRLRVLSGVDEELLSWVPTERARYTGLGGVVLGTAVIGSVSMWFALTEVLGGVHIGALVLVLLWGAFLLNLDRWLVASSTGTRWQRRVSMLLPRLTVAFVLGVVIAEPIVLRVFQTAVEKHVLDERGEEVDTLRDSLSRCNPAVDDKGMVPATADIPGCTGFALSFSKTPNAVAAELAAARADVSNLQERLKKDMEQAERLEDFARKECAGTTGPGLTGVPGNGPECTRARQKSDEFARKNAVATDQRELAARQRAATGLEARLHEIKSWYMAERNTKIDQRVAKLVASQEAIGLLERFRALKELVGGDPFLWLAMWFVRGFFILIDCMPVLVKLFGGTSPYDRLVDIKLDSAQRVFSEATKTAEREVVVDLDIQRYGHESRLRRSREEVDLANQQHTAQMSRNVDETIDRLADKLFHQSRANDRVNGRPVTSKPAPTGTTSSPGNGGETR